MMMYDLHDEALARFQSSDVFGQLEELVGRPPLIHLRAGALPITRNGRWWSPAEEGDGVEAVIVPALSERGKLIDLVAFTMSNPATFMVLAGHAPVLGAAEPGEAWIASRRARVVRTPLEYLKLAGRAMVILSPKECRRYLLDCRSDILCSDEALARQVSVLMRWPEPVYPDVAYEVSDGG